MNHYVTISNSYRFGRIIDSMVDKYMPKDLKPIVEYLEHDHGVQIEGIYLENYKSPDTVVVMKGKLPITILKVKFPEDRGLRYSEVTIISDNTFSSLEGSQT